MKYLKTLNELKEWKRLKPFRPYGVKAINVSGIELNDICQKLKINEKASFISSGSFGNAYSIGDDRVLKITSDKREAKTAWDLIKANNPSIVKYSGVWRYQLRDGMAWVVLMEKVEPLQSYIKNNLFRDRYMVELTDDALDLAYFNWNEISHAEFISEIEKKWILNGSGKKIVNCIWDCYKSLKSFSILDFHKGNLGFTKDGRLVLFDVSPLNLKVRRFDDVPILN
jgi:hypothetical protein